jgi:hypothetical protein
MIDVHLTRLLHGKDLGSSTLVMTPQLPHVAFVPSHVTARDITPERNRLRMFRLAALSGHLTSGLRVCVWLAALSSL